MKYWVDGALVDAERAAVAVADHGFTVGDGVFETLKIVLGPEGDPVPFALDRHLSRLARSASGVGLDGLDHAQARAALLAVCTANPELAHGGRIRLTLTSGAGPLGSERAPGEATLVVVAATASAWPPSTRLAMCPWPRNERSPLTGLKSTSYAENVLALTRAKSLGAGEALLTNLAGEVCEGTGSNVFLVFDGITVTPPLDSGCLAGVTRDLVLEWGSTAGLPVEERRINQAELSAADEIFITSSTRDIQPVDSLCDDHGEVIWRSDRWPWTARLAEVFADAARGDWNP